MSVGLAGRIFNSSVCVCFPDLQDGGESGQDCGGGGVVGGGGGGVEGGDGKGGEGVEGGGGGG